MQRKSADKIKGTIIFIFGAALFAYVCNFDFIMRRPLHFGTKAILGFIVSILAMINGLRIFNRK